jgi:hypothetical protein
LLGRTLRYLVLLAVAGLTLALPLSAGAIPVGPFASDVSTSQNAHANFLSVSGSSGCFTATPAPTVTTDPATRKYLAYAFTNDTGTDVCITIDYTATVGHVFVAAYLGSFDPNNLATNFVGSGPHGTDCGGTQGSFGFQVPAGQSFVIVVEECTPGGGGQFSFSIGTLLLGVTAPDNITKQASPTSIAAPGGPVTFTLTVPNPNPYQVTVTLNDDVYGDLSNQNNAVSQNTCEGQTTIAANATLTCSFVANVTGAAGSQHQDTVTATYTAFEAQATATGSATVTIMTPTAATFRSANASATARGVVVRWRTGTEAQLLGFQVDRSSGHEWQRITRSLIAARGSLSGAAYRNLDRTARRGVAYRYRIKAVNRDGTASWFGPVRVRR